MKKLLLALMLCSFTAMPALAETAKPAPTKAAHKFPLPKDATGGESQPGGGGKILMYKIPRGKDAVITEVRDTLKKEGWKFAKDETSPRGAVRLEVEKGGETYKVSFVGDDKQAALILTLP